VWPRKPHHPFLSDHESEAKEMTRALQREQEVLVEMDGRQWNPIRSLFEREPDPTSNIQHPTTLLALWIRGGTKGIS
jgi:hypothetical protein